MNRLFLSHMDVVDADAAGVTISLRCPNTKTVGNWFSGLKKGVRSQTWKVYENWPTSRASMLTVPAIYFNLIA